MTIQEIKTKLSILTVLHHYGLRMNTNAMLACPFHDDQKASMKIYRATNTVYCFAGSCEIKNLDAIDFIMKKESCTKHEALNKAKSFISEALKVQSQINFPNQTISKDTMTKTTCSVSNDTTHLYFKSSSVRSLYNFLFWPPIAWDYSQ